MYSTVIRLLCRLLKSFNFMLLPFIVIFKRRRNFLGRLVINLFISIVLTYVIEDVYKVIYVMCNIYVM